MEWETLSSPSHRLLSFCLIGMILPVQTSRLLKNAHLRRYPHPSSLRRTSKYALLLRIAEALHLGIFEQPMKIDFFSKLLGPSPRKGHKKAAIRSFSFR